MGIVDQFRQRISRLLTAPVEELGSWARLARSQIQLWGFCARRLQQNNAMAMSAALSFRTIFALVPTIILAFLMLKSLGVVEDQKQMLRDLMQEMGLSQISYVEESQSGADQDEQQRYGQETTLAGKIESIVAHVEAQLTVGRLGPVGVALLIWAAITLLTTVERSLNRVFEAPRSRSLGKRIMLYWSAVTLGPLALIAVGQASTTTASLAQSWPFLMWLTRWGGWAWPVVAGAVLLGGFYKLMPNTHIRYRDAVGGAIVASLLWLLARWGFAIYVDRVGRQSIYGAMGLVPLFLMWLNLSWWIFLFGAEIAHTVANLSQIQSAHQAAGRMLGPWDMLDAVVAIARRNLRTGGPVDIEDVAESLQLPEDSCAELLDRLSDGGMICRVSDADTMSYLLAKPADGISVTDVLRIGSPYAAGGPAVQASDVARSVREVVSAAEAGIEQLTIGQIIAR